LLHSLPIETPIWWYVTALCLGALVIGIAKAGFGGGIGVIAVPLVANALPAERAIGVMLPILIFADLFSVYSHRRGVSWIHLRPLLIGACLGIALGSWVLWTFQETGQLTGMLNISVGLICLIFVGLQVYRWLGGRVPRIPPGPGGGAASGFFAGTASAVAHSAGPVVSIYLLEQRLDKSRLVATMVLFFLVVNCLKLPTYFGLGLITQQTLLESAQFAMLVPVGIMMGLWMHKRLAEGPFTLIMYLGAALAGGRMLYLAWADL
tara:strand:+ start:643 stop:1434 length:792 start_codon:yes stop_codon:yes gene_type:complete